MDVFRLVATVVVMVGVGVAVPLSRSAVPSASSRTPAKPPARIHR
jgi:hypothetical protein